LAKNSWVPSDYRCLDHANPIDSPICCRFPSWSIHPQNYRNDYFRYRSNRSDWSHSHWMIPSSWHCRSDCSWHRSSATHFRATNPIHSIQTDWIPIRSNPIGLSQIHWSLIHWNHWIGLSHSTRSLIRSTNDCSSTKARSAMSIRLNHLTNRWTQMNQNLMNGLNRSSLKRRSLIRTNLMPRNTRTRGWRNLSLMMKKQSSNSTDRSTMNLQMSCC
jgi:hypothetical protein